MRLEEFGLNPWLKDRVDQSKLIDCKLTRVTAVNRDSYLVGNGTDEIFAELSGKFLFHVDTPMDYPAVGDWVYTQILDGDSLAIIHELLPRKSLLKRKTPGKRIDFQLTAANIDTACVMQSLDAGYNIRRLERYLAMIHQSGIQPVVLLSKSDLPEREELDERLANIRDIVQDITVLAFSNTSGEGLEQVREMFVPGETFCLLGSSGVGKTTLLNSLLGDDRFETQEVRWQDDKGKHTTSRRQMILLYSGAIVVDTPGMRELGNFAVESGIEDTFSEIAELVLQCRFTDCRHEQEDGCAVLQALEEGTITRQRYENYIKMTRESAYYEMSYLEKRRRDKEFGKMVKSVMKHHRKK